MWQRIRSVGDTRTGTGVGPSFDDLSVLKGNLRPSSYLHRILDATEFLAVYDYGTGGVWVYLLADSAAQIHERYPELRVVSDRPDWLTGEEDRRLRERMTIGIDDTQNKFLAALLQQRT